MKRRDKSANPASADGSADPLEEALRQVGADILNEPVPEALRRVLRGDRPGSEPEPDPDPANGDRRQETRRP